MGPSCCPRRSGLEGFPRGMTIFTARACRPGSTLITASVHARALLLLLVLVVHAAGWWVVGAGCWCWVLGVGCWVLGVGCWVLGVGCVVVSFWGYRLGCSCSQRQYNSRVLACSTPMLVDTIPHIEHPPATMQPRVRQVHGCCACAWQTNSSFGDAGHINADMLQLATEGVDYIKVRLLPPLPCSIRSLPLKAGVGEVTSLQCCTLLIIAKPRFFYSSGVSSLLCPPTARTTTPPRPLAREYLAAFWQLTSSASH